MHEISRGSAGARTISGQLKNQAEAVRRYMARSLMKEAGLVNTQHRYTTTNEESVGFQIISTENSVPQGQIKSGVVM